MVLATQNPIESEGTYALPEAQLDRFMLKALVDLPVATGRAADPRALREHELPVRQVVELEDLMQAREAVKQVTSPRACATTSSTSSWRRVSRRPTAWTRSCR